MMDASSRPHHCPLRTPARAERRIIGMRINRRWGPVRIGYHLGVHPSTVHRVLARYGLARLCWLDRATVRVIRRYEHTKPGDLVHVDIKKLGRILTAAVTAPSAGAPGRQTRPAPPPTGGPAITTCTTRSMAIPGFSTRRSSATNARHRSRVLGTGRSVLCILRITCATWHRALHGEDM